MVKVIGPRKKRWYDDSADWVPAKGRKFAMKGRDAPPEQGERELKLTQRAWTRRTNKETCTAKAKRCS